MIESRTYPILEFERKRKKSRRRRRIAVVGGANSSPAWHPIAVEYSSRVKLDGGIVEKLTCVNSEIWRLANIQTYLNLSYAYFDRVDSDGGIIESKRCLDDSLRELL